MVKLDVSGWVDDALPDRFAREIGAITRRLEAGLLWVVDDDRMRHLTRLDAAAAGPRACAIRSFQGGGGTNFTLLLQEADTHRLRHRRRAARLARPRRLPATLVGDLGDDLGGGLGGAASA